MENQENTSTDQQSQKKEYCGFLGDIREKFQMMRSCFDQKNIMSCCAVMFENQTSIPENESVKGEN